jgi:two-component system response regulator GlrR
LKILVVDDDPDTRYMIEVFFRDIPHEVAFSSNGKEAIEIIHNGGINIVVTDIRMPEMGGEAVLDAVQKYNPAIPVIIMTSYGTIEDAVHFLKSGAYDYVTKPLTHEEFHHRIKLAVDSFRMSEEISRLKSSLKRFSQNENIVGNSQAIRKVMETLPAIAQTDASVVIYGDSGTGKELVARTIHNFSRRSAEPFVAVNCGALPENLLESELFGYKRGAFTDAHADTPGLVLEANRGTLFLDEVGDISPKVQVKLLRFLQEKEIKPLGSTKTQRADVRIVSATNRNLPAAIAEGVFREDLYYRLNIVPIFIPPLRDRKEDIPLLANHFLLKFAKEFSKDVKELSPLALQKLVGYNWPGNIRELENKIQQTVVMATSNVVQPEDIDLPGELNTFKEEKSKVLSQFEYSYLTKLLSLHEGNISRASRAAGMDRKNFWQLMKKHSVVAKDFAVS